MGAIEVLRLTLFPLQSSSSSFRFPNLGLSRLRASEAPLKKLGETVSISMSSTKI